MNLLALHAFGDSPAINVAPAKMGAFLLMTILSFVVHIKIRVCLRVLTR